MHESNYYQLLNNTAYDDRFATAIGRGATAKQYAGIALGHRASSDGQYAIAIGGGDQTKTQTKATGDCSIAMGMGSAAGGAYSSTIGTYASASADATNGIAFGSNASVTKQSGVAIGTYSQASGQFALNLASNAKKDSGSASGDYSVAIGTDATSSGNYSMALGYKSSSAVENAIALGANSTVVSSDGSVLSIGNSNGLTRKIIHVKAGENPTDAANYGQLISTRETYQLKASTAGSKIYTTTLAINSDESGKYSGPTITIDTSGFGSVSGDVSNKADTDLGNITAAGNAKINNAFIITNGGENSNVTVTPTTNSSTGVTTYTIDVKTDTSPTKDSNNLITSGAVANALDGKANKDLDNISEKGENKVKELAQSAITVKDDGKGYITVKGEQSADKTNTTYTVSLNTDALKGAISDGEVSKDNGGLVTGGKVFAAIEEAGKNKANLDASNIGTNLKGSDGTTAATDAEKKANLDAWGKALGTGTVEKDSQQLVTGATVYGVIGGDDDYGTDTELNNISKTTTVEGQKERQTTVKENIGALDKNMGKVTNLTHETTGVKGLDGKVIGSDGSKYTAKDLTTVVQAVDEKVGDASQLNAILDVKGNTIGTEGSEYKTADVTNAMLAVNEKVGDLSKDGNLVKKGNSAAQNISILDTAIGSKDDYGTGYNISTGDDVSLKKNIGALDAAIGTTADGAFVSSGNSVGQNLNALDRGLSDLGDRVNKVGAGAAALSALHVQDFDPDDKFNLAVGFGHYKDANAGAIGAFYKPNRDTTFSIATTIGNGDNMLNAGISFKLGKSSRVEKTMVVKADYEALQQKVAAQEKKLAIQDAEIEELKKQVALLVARG